MNGSPSYKFRRLLSFCKTIAMAGLPPTILELRQFSTAAAYPRYREPMSDPLDAFIFSPETYLELPSQPLNPTTILNGQYQAGRIFVQCIPRNPLICGRPSYSIAFTAHGQPAPYLSDIRHGRVCLDREDGDVMRECGLANQWSRFRWVLEWPGAAEKGKDIRIGNGLTRRILIREITDAIEVFLRGRTRRYVVSGPGSQPREVQLEDLRIVAVNYYGRFNWVPILALDYPLHSIKGRFHISCVARTMAPTLPNSMYTAPPLPDEIISEILAPALEVSEQNFCYIGTDASPFVIYTESPRAYLVVCKAWLRVSTPLLYHTVVLRSKAQSKALARTLVQVPELGRFIKRLRIESGYGTYMRPIIQAAPNISDLFLSLDIYTTDNTDSLCQALASINPERLILQETNKKLTNKMFTKLLWALEEIIPHWKRLTRYHCCGPTGHSIAASCAAQMLAPAFVKAQRLSTWVVPSSHDLVRLCDGFQGCPLKSVVISKPLDGWELNGIENLPAEIKALTKFTMKKSRKPVPAADLTEAPVQSFTPMSTAAAEAQEAVWSRVLYFAIGDGSPRLPFLLVSKIFYVSKTVPMTPVALLDSPQRLGLPFYYSSLQLDVVQALPKFNQVLMNHPEITRSVRSILMNIHTYDDLDQSKQCVASTFSKLSGLVRVDTPEFLIQYHGLLEMDMGSLDLPWTVLEVLARHSGSTLEECALLLAPPSDGDKAATLKPLARLVKLRRLVWCCLAPFSTEMHNDALVKVEEISIIESDESFLSLLSQLQLNSLRKVTLIGLNAQYETFLRIHGHKLQELTVCFRVLDTFSMALCSMCPNLRVLILQAKDTIFNYDRVTPCPPELEDLVSETPFAHLTKIVIRPGQHDFKPKEYEENGWPDFLNALEPHWFPSLRDLELTFFHWPTQERDIKKCFWAKSAESLAKHGLNVVDGDGNRWRARLK
ncbi:unnamed protein product [Mycena citricolor]|uniref:Uncharacterized protein n=1 Tax=Mycena citricolor TaxID=2018698 RepID=A0AAD2HMK0_9AGAR|nr:unnamed protein product [Mycena citricolor]CAK5279134.1 unnamed protein product [Mycena citricolor]